MSDITASAKAKEKEKPGAAKTRRNNTKKPDLFTDPSLNMAELRELADLVDERGFTEFEFENENIRVRLSKQTSPPQMQPVQHYAGQSASTPTPPVPDIIADSVGNQPQAAPAEDLFKITSPIVGTFYRSAGPDKEPYVKEGTLVSADSVVCIIEAMKLMNEIQAEVSGEVVEIYIENGQPVEYGQALFGIRK